MTSVYFVRHAQPDTRYTDDRIKPLTPLGLSDSKTVTKTLADLPIDAFYASPYPRSIQTIADCAQAFGMEIRIDERFREREAGVDSRMYLEQRWEDFSFHEPGGESLGSVQARNIEALKELLSQHENQHIVIGTHGTALSTIMKYYDPSCGLDWFWRIVYCMPFIIRMDFEDGKLIAREELLSLERGYE